MVLVFACLTTLNDVVRALDNGLAMTPPMGWMAWERFRCNVDCVNDPDNCISENLFMEMADRMAADGWKEAGYEFVLIDDCWQAERRTPGGALQPNATRFPHGIAWLADYVHAKGLKLGIYSDYGTKSCGGYPGSEGHLQQDADTFASWGVDSLKFDGCYSNVSSQPAAYGEMSQYLNETGRPILFSCSWPAYWNFQNPPFPTNYTLVAEQCNLWRLWDDIQDEWSSVEGIISYWANKASVLVPAAGPGHWNSPDQLIIGDTALSNATLMWTQMAMWSMFASPMYMSNDLRNISDTATAILQHQGALAISQDPLGVQASSVLLQPPTTRGGAWSTARSSRGGTIGPPDLAAPTAWHRPLANGDVAVALFNSYPYSSSVQVQVPLPSVGVAGGCASAVDVYTGESLGRVNGDIHHTLGMHETVLLRLTPCS